MKILSVIPLKKGILKGDLSYFSSQEIPLGHVVSVPVRNKSILALVTSSADVGHAKADIKELNFNLKKVIEDKGPSVFAKEFLDAAFEASRYFAAEKSLGLPVVIPSAILENYDKIASLCRQGTVKPSEASRALPEKLIFQHPLSDRISIYKTLIREAFARKESVYMVLPAGSDIETWNEELGRGIEQFAFGLHGGLSAKKIVSVSEKILGSEHPVLILGTVPFLSLPRGDIRTIILEHESSGGYRTIRRPYVDLRVFAEAFASKIGAKFIMADELLRFETIGRAERDHLHHLYPPSYRVNFDGEMAVFGKERKWNGKFKIFSDDSLEELRNAVENKKNAFVFALRKGLATETLCRDCGETLHCEDCAAPLVLYTTLQGEKRMFVCNRCERDWGADRLCPRCRSWNLMPLGIGTDTVCEELRRSFPKTKVYKLDKESAKSEAGARKIIKDFESEKGAILVGTEMAFYYFKNKVSLGIVASFDSLWSIPNYKMSEKIVHIILSMTKTVSGRIILETKNPADPTITAAQSGNLLQFIRSELEDRKALGYPPFARFIKITYLGDKNDTRKAKELLTEMFAEHEPHIFSGFVSRLKGQYVTNALIKLDPSSWSLKEVSSGIIDGSLYQKLSMLPPSFEVRVDPEDLL